MRILLINIQILVLVVISAAVTAAGGSLAGMTAGGMGVGPAMLGAAAYLIAVFTAALAVFVVFAVPLALISSATLIAAILSGYRYLRWVRFIGVFANILGAAYFLGLPYLTELVPMEITAAFALLPCCNAILFVLIPKRPNTRRTFAMAKIYNPAAFLCVAAPITIVAVNSLLSPDVGVACAGGVALVLYALPLLYNHRAISTIDRAGVDALTVRKTAISSLVTILALIFIFPLGLPLLFGSLLLLELLELKLAYPAEPPPHGTPRYWIARVMGGPPLSAATDESAKNNCGESLQADNVCLNDCDKENTDAVEHDQATHQEHKAGDTREHQEGDEKNIEADPTSD